ncbi:MAG: 1-acyl-sn-glycerol-3-phosphate acyltransferase [Nanoarchaeota archaeon]|nr:1-acyl-sn-glycerol-3-phosphate acyltransferase [Nanoarchaeota archaeon]
MVSLEDLGILHKPNEKVYKNIMKFSHYLVGHVLKDAFELYGKENLEEDYYQIFLCNHKFYTDPPLAQIAIALASGNDKPIPAPAYKSYIHHKALGPLLAALFSYPIYDKGDGEEKKEQSLEYSVESFLQQERILIFPEGRISHDGLLARGKLGSAEIAWRAYHKMQADPELSKKKKGMKMIPMEISYYPIAGVPLKDLRMMTVRFGKSLDVEKELISKYYSDVDTEDKEKLKKNLQMVLMNDVMKEIGSLATVNMEETASKVLHYLVDKGRWSIKKEDFLIVLDDVVEALNTTSLNMLNHFKDEEDKQEAYKLFLKRCKKRHILKEKKGELRFNLEYVFSQPEFKHVRNKNVILYNKNLLEHLQVFKDTVEETLNKELV